MKEGELGRVTNDGCQGFIILCLEVVLELELRAELRGNFLQKELRTRNRALCIGHVSKVHLAAHNVPLADNLLMRLYGKLEQFLGAEGSFVNQDSSNISTT